MHKFRRLAAGIAIMGLTAGLTFATAAPAQALTGFSNGSFETPVVTPGTFQDFHPGESIGAWTVIQGNVDLIGAGFWQAADGVQSLDLEGSESPLIGGVAQTFSTIPLLKYKVTYKLAGNPASGPQVKTGQIRANGNVIQSFSFDVTGRTLRQHGLRSQGNAFHRDRPVDDPGVQEHHRLRVRTGHRRRGCGELPAGHLPRVASQA
jgi:choice-of-anchor C domain-containing protein